MAIKRKKIGSIYTDLINAN